jgi:hypothetical protein
MVFYGTILPPEQSHSFPTLVSIKQNQTSGKSSKSGINSGECRVTTTKCLGLLLILSTILIPGSF